MTIVLPREAALPPRPPRHMPNIWTIASYWAGRGVFEVDLAVPACFGCQWPSRRQGARRTDDRWWLSRLDRAHLVDRALGGLDGPQNLALLCSRCHKVMPSFAEEDGQRAIRWVQDGGFWPAAADEVPEAMALMLAGTITPEQAVRRIAKVSALPRADVREVFGRHDIGELIKAQSAAGQ